MPARSNSRVRLAFEDFTGTEYPRHIFDHENNGTMSVISVS